MQAQSIELTRVEKLGQTLETQLIGHISKDLPCLVFLHEGLGSLALWREFPQRLCDALELPGLVYSRLGYGRSELRKEPPGTNFMHIEALETLPALLKQLNIHRPILFGHSDGASIALIFAASKLHPRPLACVLLAPHIMVENICVQAISQAKQRFAENEIFRGRLARYHADAAHSFYNWANVWLDPAFLTWQLHQEVAQLGVPTLAIQGLNDQYGSLAQIRQIARGVPLGTRVELLEVPNCQHNPHQEASEQVLASTKAFLSKVL